MFFVYQAQQRSDEFAFDYWLFANVSDEAMHVFAESLGVERTQFTPAAPPLHPVSMYQLTVKQYAQALLQDAANVRGIAGSLRYRP